MINCFIHGMHPPLQLGGEGGLEILEKSLLGGQKFLFWWGGGDIVEVKIKITH